MTTGRGLSAFRLWAACGLFLGGNLFKWFAANGRKPLRRLARTKQPAHSPPPTRRQPLVGSHILQLPGRVVGDARSASRPASLYARRYPERIQYSAARLVGRLVLRLARQGESSR